MSECFICGSSRTVGEVLDGERIFLCDGHQRLLDLIVLAIKDEIKKKGS